MAAQDELRSRLERVRERIAHAARRVGRDASEVTVVAVSKTFSPEIVRMAVEAGATDLGENRAQELKSKVSALGGVATWHFVGPLQTNKVRIVVGTVGLIHSVDREALAGAIAGRARSLDLVQDVLIEVNLSGEAAKHGIAAKDTVEFAHAVQALDHINVIGLMTMAPFSDDPETSRPFFSQLARLRDAVVAEVPGAAALSMGMSRDFEVGVEEGATLVRVGEAIFGSRLH